GRADLGSPREKPPPDRAGKRPGLVSFFAGTFWPGDRAGNPRFAGGRRDGDPAPARGHARRHLRQSALLYFDAALDGMPAPAGAAGPARPSGAAFFSRPEGSGAAPG